MDAVNDREKFVVTFNRDCTSLAVGSKTGCHIYTLSEIDFLKRICSTDDTKDICLIEQFSRSCVVLMVSLSLPRNLTFYHINNRRVYDIRSFKNSILAVKMNRLQLVVLLEDKLHIYSVQDLKLLHTIEDTPPNPQGLCALTMSTDETCYLAYLGSSTTGEVQLFDVTNLVFKIRCLAHKSPLAAMAFSPYGTRIATASEKGTVIRVFSVPDGAKQYEFRRGLKRCVEISCLTFSTCARYLGCSSNTETVHIFKLEDSKKIQRAAKESTWWGYVTNYFSSQVSDVLNQDRAFATAHLPIFGVKNAVAIITIQNQLRLLVASELGYLYVYNFYDGTEGGDLKLLYTHRLHERVDNTHSSSA